MKLVILSITTIILIAGIKARSIKTDTNAQKPEESLKLWQPESGTREEFFRCKGMPCDQYEKKMQKLKKLQEEIKDKNQVNHELGDLEEGCVWLTEENVDEMTEELNDDSQTRFKRKLAVENHASKQHLRWEMPINYKFDGTHSKFEQEQIKKAITEWETSTCVSFVERKTDENMDKHHLVITKKYNGCFSYVGKNYKAQLVNLGLSCLFEPGVAVHELGHSLGLWHEHQRQDREKWVKINTQNIYAYASQFSKIDDTISHDVPYDFTSVMHYPGTAGGYGGKLVIEAHDPLYQSSMGQRMGLSYFDAKIINLAYCKDKCSSSSLNKPCQRGGYQDPNNCNRCICPDGFSGTFCEDIAASKSAQCGGTINLSANGDKEEIKSPDYEVKKSYENYDECTWIIKSPANHKVVMNFDGEFGLYTKNRETCYHYVEVKYGDDFEYPGPRFCGYTTPKSTLSSKTNEMVVIMKANHETNQFLTSQRRGFKAVFHSESLDGSSPTSSTASTTTTTKTTTSATPKSSPPKSSTTTSTTTTTTQPTQTTTKKDTKWSEWSGCSHECDCGGCSTQSRHTICGTKRCTGALERIETKLCDRVCQVKDKRVFPGANFSVPCPRCCGGLKTVKGKCV